VPNTTKKTEEQVLQAIRDSGGILMTIARRLRVTRMSVNRYLARWPVARRAYDEEVDIIGDQVEKVILDAIFRGDVKMAMWYCELKLKDRGYGKPTKHPCVNRRRLPSFREPVR
jgi:hypothetical protein